MSRCRSGGQLQVLGSGSRRQRPRQGTVTLDLGEEQEGGKDLRGDASEQGEDRGLPPPFTERTWRPVFGVRASAEPGMGLVQVETIHRRRW